eukprot:6178002-Pleurochrysis_carterae.AAC.5
MHTLANYKQTDDRHKLPIYSVAAGFKALSHVFTTAAVQVLEYVTGLQMIMRVSSSSTACCAQVARNRMLDTKPLARFIIACPRTIEATVFT